MKTIKFLSMAALALVGIMMTGCSSEDNIINEPQQPTNTDNVVTLTTTVGFDSGAASTSALTSGGEKTFAIGDKIAVIYTNTDDATVKAVSSALTSSDITNGGKSATFTVTLSNPKVNGNVKYIYPAAMAGDTDVDYTKLATQDGTLTSLAANLDLAVYNGTLTSDAKLPASLTLTNQLAILACTLKDADGNNDITNTITALTVNDGTNNYTVSRPTAAGPIYVAIRPTDTKDILVTATDNSKIFTKSLTSKTYEKNNGYNVSWRMTEGATSTIDLTAVSSDTEIPNGALVTGTLGGSYKISIADGAIVILNNVTINASSNDSCAGISCAGDATIIINGTNTVTASQRYYPDIHIPSGFTLTIQGEGSLTATANNEGAGIGAGSYSSRKGGNIIINSGTIIIEGDTIIARGGSHSAGIGGSYHTTCGNITITKGVTSVTATKGNSAPYSIGAGPGSTCGTVTIGGSVTGPISTSPYTYKP